MANEQDLLQACADLDNKDAAMGMAAGTDFEEPKTLSNPAPVARSPKAQPWPWLGFFLANRHTGAAAWTDAPS